MKPPGLVRCPECGESGRIECQECEGVGGWVDILFQKHRCKVCFGLKTQPCPLCIGEGRVTEAVAKEYRDAIKAGRTMA